MSDSTGLQAMLGPFVFIMDMAAQYNQLEHQYNSNLSTHVIADKKGTVAVQASGASKQFITLSGTVYPGQMGSALTTEVLVYMARQGVSYPLFIASGVALGFWFIDNCTFTHTHLSVHGLAQRIDFTLRLLYDKSLAEGLSDLHDYVKSELDSVAEDFSKLF